MQQYLSYNGIFRTGTGPTIQQNHVNDMASAPIYEASFLFFIAHCKLGDAQGFSHHLISEQVNLGMQFQGPRDAIKTLEGEYFNYFIL